MPKTFDTEHREMEETSLNAELQDRVAELEDALKEVQEELESERRDCQENHTASEDVPDLSDLWTELRDFVHRFRYRSAPSHPSVAELITAMQEWEREYDK